MGAETQLNISYTTADDPGDIVSEYFRNKKFDEIKSPVDETIRFFMTCSVPYECAADDNNAMGLVAVKELFAEVSKINPSFTCECEWTVDYTISGGEDRWEFSYANGKITNIIDRGQEILTDNLQRYNEICEKAPWLQEAIMENDGFTEAIYVDGMAPEALLYDFIIEEIEEDDGMRELALRFAEALGEDISEELAELDEDE